MALVPPQAAAADAVPVGARTGHSHWMHVGRRSLASNDALAALDAFRRAADQCTDAAEALRCRVLQGDAHLQLGELQEAYICYYAAMRCFAGALGRPVVDVTVPMDVCSTADAVLSPAGAHAAGRKEAAHPPTAGKSVERTWGTEDEACARPTPVVPDEYTAALARLGYASLAYALAAQDHTAAQLAWLSAAAAWYGHAADASEGVEAKVAPLLLLAEVELRRGAYRRAAEVYAAALDVVHAKGGRPLTSRGAGRAAAHTAPGAIKHQLDLARRREQQRIANHAATTITAAFRRRRRLMRQHRGTLDLQRAGRGLLARMGVPWCAERVVATCEPRGRQAIARMEGECRADRTQLFRAAHAWVTLGACEARARLEVGRDEAALREMLRLRCRFEHSAAEEAETDARVVAAVYAARGREVVENEGWVRGTYTAAEHAARAHVLDAAATAGYRVRCHERGDLYTCEALSREGVCEAELAARGSLASNYRTAARLVHCGILEAHGRSNIARREALGVEWMREVWVQAVAWRWRPIDARAMGGRDDIDDDITRTEETGCAVGEECIVSATANFHALLADEHRDRTAIAQHCALELHAVAAWWRLLEIAAMCRAVECAEAAVRDDIARLHRTQLAREARAQRVRDRVLRDEGATREMVTVSEGECWAFLRDQVRRDGVCAAAVAGRWDLVDEEAAARGRLAAAQTTVLDAWRRECVRREGEEAAQRARDATGPNARRRAVQQQQHALSRGMLAHTETAARELLARRGRVEWDALASRASAAGRLAAEKTLAREASAAAKVREVAAMRAATLRMERARVHARGGHGACPPHGVRALSYHAVCADLCSAAPIPSPAPSAMGLTDTATPPSTALHVASSPASSGPAATPMSLPAVRAVPGCPSSAADDAALALVPSPPKASLLPARPHADSAAWDRCRRAAAALEAAVAVTTAFRPLHQRLRDDEAAGREAVEQAERWGRKAVGAEVAAACGWVRMRVGVDVAGARVDEAVRRDSIREAHAEGVDGAAGCWVRHVHQQVCIAQQRSVLQDEGVRRAQLRRAAFAIAHVIHRHTLVDPQRVVVVRRALRVWVARWRARQRRQHLVAAAAAERRVLAVQQRMDTLMAHEAAERKDITALEARVGRSVYVTSAFVRYAPHTA